MDLLCHNLVAKVLANLAPRDLCSAAATNRLFYQASGEAFRLLCEASGRRATVQEFSQWGIQPPHKCIPVLVGTQGASAQTAAHACQSTALIDQPPKELDHSAADISWSQAYHLQTFALHFNGLNDFVRLPAISLVSTEVVRQGLTIEITFKCSPNDCWSVPETLAGYPPGGGALLSCQNREFGRSRRPQRLLACPLLFVGTEGTLIASMPGLPPDLNRCSERRLQQDCWHQAAVALVPWGPESGDDPQDFAWCLYLNGEMQGPPLVF
ncbi:hypothetical protein WJX74_009938 [Apatococcus lobatus]